MMHSLLARLKVLQVLSEKPAEQSIKPKQLTPIQHSVEGASLLQSKLQVAALVQQL